MILMRWLWEAEDEALGFGRRLPNQDDVLIDALGHYEIALRAQLLRRGLPLPPEMRGEPEPESERFDGLPQIGPRVD